MVYMDQGEKQLFMIWAAVMTFLFSVIGLTCYASSQAYDQFMSECLKDHKRYECVSMYRGHSENVVIVPVSQ